MDDQPRAVRVRAVPWTTTTEERIGRIAQGLPAYLRRARALERSLERLEALVGARYARELRRVEVRSRACEHAVVRGRGEARARSMLEAAEAAFDRRWLRWLERELDLRPLNDEIERFNRYYPIERQCALRHVPVNALPFRPREPVRVAALLRRYPLRRPPRA